MDLIALLEAVEADDEQAANEACRVISRAAHDAGKFWPALTAIKAFRGSLDAAKAIHESLLPDWIAKPQIGGLGAGVTAWQCTVEHWDSGDEFTANNSPNPARAWLLAILRAIAAEEAK